MRTRRKPWRQSPQRGHKTHQKWTQGLAAVYQTDDDKFQAYYAEQNRGICPTLPYAKALALASPCPTCKGTWLRLQMHFLNPRLFSIRCNAPTCVFGKVHSDAFFEYRELPEALTRWEQLEAKQREETARAQLFMRYLQLFVSKAPTLVQAKTYLYTQDCDEVHRWVFAYRKPSLVRSGTMAIALLDAARQLTDAERHKPYD